LSKTSAVLRIPSKAGISISIRMYDGAESKSYIRGQCISLLELR
jgi:hypothetical protein